MLTTCFNAFVLNVFLLIESKQNLFLIIQTICFSFSCIFDFSILRNPRVFWVNILVIVFKKYNISKTVTHLSGLQEPKLYKNISVKTKPLKNALQSFNCHS